jgi:peroxiredoxin
VNKIIEKGDHPPIHDFNLFDADGNDITEDVLAEPYIFLIVTHDITKASVVNLEKMKALSKDAFSAGYYVYGLTSSDKNTVEDFRHEHQLEFDFSL